MNDVFYIITQEETLLLSDVYLKEATYMALLSEGSEILKIKYILYLAHSRHSINNL